MCWVRLGLAGFFSTSSDCFSKRTLGSCAFTHFTFSVGILVLPGSSGASRPPYGISHTAGELALPEISGVCGSPYGNLVNRINLAEIFCHMRESYFLLLFLFEVCVRVCTGENASELLLEFLALKRNNYMSTVLLKVGGLLGNARPFIRMFRFG